MSWKRLIIEGAVFAAKMTINHYMQGNSPVSGIELGGQDALSTGADTVASLLINSPNEEATQGIIDAWVNSLFS